MGGKQEFSENELGEIRNHFYRVDEIIKVNHKEFIKFIFSQID